MRLICLLLAEYLSFITLTCCTLDARKTHWIRRRNVTRFHTRTDRMKMTGGKLDCVNVVDEINKCLCDVLYTNRADIYIQLNEMSGTMIMV